MWVHRSRSNLYNATLTYISQECGRYRFGIDIANYRNPSTYALGAFSRSGSRLSYGNRFVPPYNRVRLNPIKLCFPMFSRAATSTAISHHTLQTDPILIHVTD
jgi:hypothetical protein